MARQAPSRRVADHRLECARLRRAVTRLRENYLVSEDHQPAGGTTEDAWWALFEWRYEDGTDAEVHDADGMAAAVVESALWSLRAALRKQGKERG